MKVTRWRIVEPHPEDRYEPEDDVADGIRAELRRIQSEINSCKNPGGLNQLYKNLGRLRVELAERLYGK